MAKSGDVCQKCKAGRYGVVSSRSGGAYQYRYLKCGKCKSTSIEIAEADLIRRRKYFTS